MPVLQIHKPLNKRLNPHQMMKRKARMRQAGSWRIDVSREHAKTRGAVVHAHGLVAKERVRVNRLVYAVGVQAFVLMGLVSAQLGYTWADLLFYLPTMMSVVFALLVTYGALRGGMWVMAKVRNRRMVQAPKTVSPS